ncbi:PREDICTED: mitogen-activated protein kinase-binding protein 1-like [Cyprinodon variegatus]|uniref:mitogen-activated protein kinase-binding protein 1-like n=1 Tax=Cyprinodon variegatus TaxID=28743 RepID=UPI000742775C|nr:PREDICTED: mitogen-activated protein kinase-binding protein 1-like [Cyprinodon variegatus]
MADRADRRRQPAGRRSRQIQPRKGSVSRVTLEKVLGISTVGSSFLTSDPVSGRIAYPAGCVVVLLHPQKNVQSHIINTSRKPFTALDFSHDGKHLVTGESGYMPCVRVWEVDGGQVAKVQAHKYGVSCVAFSSTSSYVVSVGFQHDRTISVWDWRKGAIIASNKVSSSVFSVSFSKDSSYFVTAGNRHIKFWNLDASKEQRVNSTVPLIGRSGLLGDYQNSVFCGVACGRGLTANNTYFVTTSGVLCLFNSSRQLEAWVDLKTSVASSLAVSEDFVFCGCGNGVIRVFRPADLQYIGTLPQPHRLGVDLTRSAQHSSPRPADPGAPHPDTLALSFDPRGQRLACVYTDHSVYVWDVRDVKNAKRLYSALYHSSCVWNIQVYPELQDPSQACLPRSSFLTCSSDNTIRVWHSDAPARHRNLYSQDLLKILYVGEDMQHLQTSGERGETEGPDGKAGIRVLGISPDGKHLAAGDRCGNVRIFGLEFLDELVKIEAHDSEVMCLEFSPASTGLKMLASASRDRLIHIFNVEKNYSLEQTLNDHSASVTAVKFTGESPEVQMVSCGADKSIYFQTAEQTADGLTFSRRHHVVEKTTLYDMDLDPTGAHVSIACQDRNVRVYNVETGKLEKSLKGSATDEGALLKVQMDPSGSFFATSCSDKNINIFDSESGECVATLFGHSELVSCMRFSQDCRHLISASGDSCVFVWRLDSQMTGTMRKRRALRVSRAAKTCQVRPPDLRRETFITVPSSQLPLMEEEVQKAADQRTPGNLDSALETALLQTNGKMPIWFRKMAETGAVAQLEAEPRQVRSQWMEPLSPLTISRNQEEEEEQQQQEEEEEDFQPQSLDSLLGDEEEEDNDEEKAVQNSTFILQPDDCNSSLTQRDFRVEGVRGQGVEPVWRTHPSPDSACSEGSAGSLEQQQDTDTDSLSQGSSVGSLGPEDDEDRDSLKNHFASLASSLNEERFDTDLTNLQPSEEKPFLNPRLSISTRFLSRFQDRVRARPGRAPDSILGRISEESNTRSRSGESQLKRSNESAGLTLREKADVSGKAVLRRRASCGGSPQPQRRLPRRRNTVLVLQCRKTLGDITSRNQMTNSATASSLPQEETQLTYLHVSTTSKPGLDHPASSQENKENLMSASDPLPSPTPLQSDPDLHIPNTIDPQEQSSSLQVLATPTMSQCEGGRWSVGSLEEASTNPNTTLIQSPAPSAPPTVKKVEGPCVKGIQTDPADSSLPATPTFSSSPLLETPRPQTADPTHPTGEEEKAVSLQQTRQVANELRLATQRAIHLYQQIGGSERYLESSSLLQEAFAAVLGELQGVTPPACSSAPVGQMQDEQTKVLLEKYSELLVQMTRNKLNKI